jgi:hypothetical protein
VTIEDLYPEKEETGTRVTVDIPVKHPPKPLQGRGSKKELRKLNPTSQTSCN